jgi:hypothetical protein
MGPNIALDIAVFQTFDAVHACLSGGAVDLRKTGFPGLRPVPRVIESVFLERPADPPATVKIDSGCAEIRGKSCGAPPHIPVPRLRCDCRSSHISVEWK